ncbi:MAG: phosphatidate cytidylyltransferase [Saprospiraceae bacterium]
MRQRIITAIVFGAAMLGGVFGGNGYFQILCLLIITGCLWELFGLLLPDEPKKTTRKVWGILVGLLPLLPLVENILLSQPGMVYFLVLLFFLSLVFELFLHSINPFQNVAIYLLGFFYICFPFVFLNWIAYDDSDLDYSPLRVFGLLLLIWTNDTMAYFIGSQLGRRKLFERISPKKTWEGTIGGGICTVLVAWGLSFIIKDFSQTQWLVLGAVAAVFGTLGDLVESMLKRSVGVKDSGNLLPGHGGLLDRFDAFIFALPFFWLALQIFKG